MTVLTVIAADVDQGNNGTVQYSLKQVPNWGSQPMFSINSHTGLISTMLDNVLDREEKAQYTLIVQAKDKGSPPMSGQCDTPSLPDVKSVWYTLVVSSEGWLQVNSLAVWSLLALITMATIQLNISFASVKLAPDE